MPYAGCKEIKVATSDASAAQTRQVMHLKLTKAPAMMSLMKNKYANAKAGKITSLNEEDVLLTWRTSCGLQAPPPT